LQGTDKLTNEVLRAHEVPGDKLELYWLRNIFNIPSHSRDTVRMHLVSDSAHEAYAMLAGPSFFIVDAKSSPPYPLSYRRPCVFSRS
jgi:hypothetical protein